MATKFWIGNQQAASQVDILTVGGVPAAGNTITATINKKTITYTVVSGDTTSTAAAGLQALLAAATAPPEFQEPTWTVVNNVITGTGLTPGMPFTVTASATGGGATLTRAASLPNLSPNDLADANNWSPSLPVAGDDVIFADSTVSVLWNLDTFAGTGFASVTRYGSFTGQIGLPENNPAGYYEYRPTYFQFKASGTGQITVFVGLGPGNGPNLERYNAGAANVNWIVQNSAAVRLLNTSPSSVFTVNGAAVDIATLPNETSNCSGGILVVNGGVLNLGAGVSFSGSGAPQSLTIDAASAAFVNCVPTTITMNGGQLAMNVTSGTVKTLTANNGAQISWNSSANITFLNLYTGSNLDKSGDTRPMTVTYSTLDNTASINDPWNAITFGSPTVVNGVITGGPISVGPGRTVQLI